MPELIADFPAVAILLPAASVYFLWALFHWVFRSGDDLAIEDHQDHDYAPAPADNGADPSDIFFETSEGATATHHQRTSETVPYAYGRSGPGTEPDATISQHAARASVADNLAGFSIAAVSSNIDANDSAAGSAQNPTDASANPATEVPDFSTGVRSSNAAHDKADHDVVSKLTEFRAPESDTRDSVSGKIADSLTSKPDVKSTGTTSPSIARLSATDSDPAESGSRHTGKGLQRGEVSSLLPDGGNDAETALSLNQSEADQPTTDTDQLVARETEVSARAIQPGASAGKGLNGSYPQKATSEITSDSYGKTHLKADQHEDTTDDAQPVSTPTHITPGKKKKLSNESTAESGGPPPLPTKYRTAARRKSLSPIDEVTLQLKSEDTPGWNTQSTSIDQLALQRAHEKQLSEKDDEISQLRRQLELLNEKQQHDESSDEEHTQYRARFEDAQMELKGSARKIHRLQSAVNTLQAANAAANVIPQHNRQPSLNDRPSLLSKVRVVGNS